MRKAGRPGAGWLSLLVSAFGAACASSGGSASKLEAATALVRTDDKNEFARAERLLDEVIAAEPTNAGAVYWKAQMLMAWSDALAEEAVYLARAEQTLARSLERAEKRVGELETPEAQEFARAIADNIRVMHDKVATTLAQWTSEAESHRKRGLELVQAEIEGQPDPPYEAHRVLADYYRIKGEHDRARQELAAVRALNPDSAGLRFIAGVMLMKVDDDLEGAIRSMDEALAVDPDFVKALYYKGLAMSRKDDPAGAEAIMKAVLTKSPGHVGARTYLDTASYVRKAEEELGRQLN